jgi:hypothetical protein
VRNGPRSLGAAVCVLALASVARAQDPVPLTEVAGELARELLAAAPEVERTHESLAPGRLARLLEDLNLEFKTFERDSGGELALGFSYDLAKSLIVSDDTHGGTLDFVANGNLAFDPDANPDDFLYTSLRLRWFGTKAFGPSSESRAAMAGSLPDPDGEALAAFDPDLFGELAARFALETEAAVIRADPDFQSLASSYFEDIERRLPPELVWDFDLHAALESNQELSSRQISLGTAVGGRLVSWNPDAGLSRFNLFDYPAAALRWLAGDDGFRASGEAWPTVVAGLDVVDASADDLRKTLTDDDSFLRGRVEAGLKSRVLTLGGEALFLSAGWRFDQEIDAPASVRTADADEHSYLQLKLDLPKGWALTYATGTLPLDVDPDSTFALGFQLRL